MKENRWFWWQMIPAFAVVTGGCCAGLWRAAHEPRNGIRVEQLEAEIRQQLLPGSTRERVPDWFERRGFKVYEMLRKDDPATDLSVIIQNDSFLDSAEIKVHLYFDRDGRLERTEISRFVFSL